MKQPHVFPAFQPQPWSPCDTSLFSQFERMQEKTTLHDSARLCTTLHVPRGMELNGKLVCTVGLYADNRNGSKLLSIMHIVLACRPSHRHGFPSPVVSRHNTIVSARAISESESWHHNCMHAMGRHLCPRRHKYTSIARLTDLDHPSIQEEIPSFAFPFFRFSSSGSSVQSLIHTLAQHYTSFAYTVHYT